MFFSTLRNPVRRIKSFTGRFVWIAREGLQGKSILVITITILSITAAAIGGITLALTAKIINSLQDGIQVHVPYTNIYIQGSELILTSALVISFLLAIASYATFYSRLKTREIARAYYVKLVARMLDSVEQRNVFVQPGSEQQHASLRNMIGRNAMHASRALERIVMMMQPLCYAFAGMATASYLSPRLSIISYFLLLFLVIPLYRKSAELNENARKFFQKTSTDMNQTMRKYISRLEASSLPAVSRMQSTGNQYISESTVGVHLDHFDNIRLAPARMLLVTSLFMAFAVGISILGIGYMLHIEKQGWGTALAFMGAFILLLRSLQNLGSTLAVLNRFYPQMVDYLEYWRVLEKIPNTYSSHLPDTLNLHVRNKKIPGSLESLEINRGVAVNIVCDRHLNRSNLAYIGGPLLRVCHLNDRHRIEFLAKALPPSFLTIKEQLCRGITASGIEGNMMEKLKHFDVLDEIQQLPDGFETILDENNMAMLGTKLTVLLYLLPLSHGNGQLILIDHNHLNEFDDTEMDYIWKIFGSFYIFVMSNSTRRMLSSLTDVIVIEDGNVVGAGSVEWLLRNEIEFNVTEAEQGGNALDDLDDME